MKKFIILGILAFAIVIFAAYFFRVKGTPGPKEVVNNNYYPILVYVEKGKIGYKVPTENNFISTTSPSITIPNMTVVRTATGSMATVLLPDNSTISLEEDTEITINYTNTNVSIFQAFGTTYHRVETLLTGGSYQVQTPETLAAVRGTKFGVSYNKKLKKTKVSVTESKVDVSTVRMVTGTTTSETKEKITLQVGDTAVVEDKVEADKTKRLAIVVMKTEKDSEVVKALEKEKARDVLLNSIKKDFSNKELIREEIRKKFFNDREDSRKEGDESGNETNKTDQTKEDSSLIKPTLKTSEETQTKEPVVTQTQQKSTETIPPGSKPLTEEAFFTQFEPLFMKYFYVDDEDAICSVVMTPEEKVKRVTLFAYESGFPIPSTRTTLTSFAKAIQEYCLKKDPTVKDELKRRFDEEYPFNDE